MAAASPQLKGSIIVTGANGGLGSAIAAQIASRVELQSSHHTLLIVRDASSAPALDAVLEGHAGSYEKLSLDLTKLDEVRKVAKEINVK